METLEIQSISSHIYLVCINRPAYRNAINSVMMRELYELWHDWAPTLPELRCLVLTGKGEQAFCAGADLKERLNLDLNIWKEQKSYLEKAIVAMLDCPIPIIAAVNGAAYGGGLELALACDFIYAADTATFAQSEAKLGLIPGAMGTQHLPQAVGLRRAKELALTGTIFTAQQGFEWELVNQVFSSQNLMSETLKTAQQIAENAPKSIRQLKKTLNASSSLDIHSGFQYEIATYNELLSTKDREEGIRAFCEKRKPFFKDE